MTSESLTPVRPDPGAVPPAQGLLPGVPRRVHLLGAGGAGLSGAALLLRARGHEPSGHDRADSPFVERLAREGMTVALGASRPEDLPADAELVVRSAAVPDEDPQVLAARERGLEVLRYKELLGRLSDVHTTLAVAGTHGKTTTSWMLLEALTGLTQCQRLAGLEAPVPGALVGGLHRRLGTNALVPEPGLEGAPGRFVVEACEYDRTFLQLRPEGAIVTNLEADHLDYYGDLETLEAAFARFADRVHPSGLLVLGRDVPARVEDAARCDVWRLGRELDVDLLSESRGRFELRVRGPGWATGAVQLLVPGSFNVDNAALAVGLAVGLTLRGRGLSHPAGGPSLPELADSAGRGVARYEGAARRFEPWGTVGGVELVHDYAHHPTEVRVTLEAARRALPGKPLHVLFQPHQESRTARFLAEFVESLRGADRVVVADVYGARVHIDGVGAGARELVERLRLAGVDAVAGGDPFASTEALVAGLPASSAALVLGAGDIDGIRAGLTQRLALRGPQAS